MYRNCRSAATTIARVTQRIGIEDAALEIYYHQMLMTLGGWAQYARYQLWQAELAGGTDETITDLLAIRLVWEEALYLRYGLRITASITSRMWMPIAAIPPAGFSSRAACDIASVYW